ncbi:hypothetical protein D3C78_1931440 [compost metagenome]
MLAQIHEHERDVVEHADGGALLAEFDAVEQGRATLVQAAPLNQVNSMRALVCGRY